jgi:hypothetical protein
MKCIFCNKGMCLVVRSDFTDANKKFYLCGYKILLKYHYRCEARYHISDDKLNYSFIEKFEDTLYKVHAVGKFYISKQFEMCNNLTSLELLDDSMIVRSTQVFNYFQPLEKSPKEIIKSILTLKSFL